MAARKLQTEVDRVLKRVAEGVEQFDEQYKKIQATTNLAHKEKLEAELKTQIKKLQRLRDQIKTWLASNEIKDKKALTDNRKLIEQQMERFKACEKEMKTKAFSKEGLNAGAKLDPKEILKMETSSFVSNMVDELGRQIEITEAEVEQLQGGAKKSKKDAKANGDRMSQLEELNDRRNWHVSRLELILRLLENGNLDPEKIQTIKEDINYFVENNTEEDFEEDEGIYDELSLDEQEEAFGMGERDDIQSSHDSMSIADTSEIVPPLPTARTPARPTKPPLNTTADKSSSQAKDNSTSTPPDDGEKSPTAAKKAPAAQRKPTLDGNAQRPTGLTSVPARSASMSTSVANLASPGPSAVSPSATPSAAAPTTASRPPLPPIRYSAAAASAVTPPQPPAAVVQPVAAATTTNASAGSTAAPLPTASQGVTSPGPSTASQTAARIASLSMADSAKAAPSSQSTTAADATLSPSPSHASVQTTAASLHTAASPSVLPRSSVSPANDAPSAVPASSTDTQNLSLDRSSTPSSAAKEAGLSTDASPRSQAQTAQQAQQPNSSSIAETRLPSSLADLVSSFESAKQKSLQRDKDLSSIHEVLDAGLSNMPQPADAERPKYYIPRNAFPTPAYYPQQPSPHLLNAELFAKFDVDTLFYIFYYCQGTYMQYLAAQELKKQSWRFHKQYLTWFQRANEPSTITDEYEQGVYLYFDFEGSWAQRRKENFSFFYKHLEE